MKTAPKTQLQVRIDARTKKDAKQVLHNIGMDASTAVNILFTQIVRTNAFPIDLRDANGFKPKKARELRGAINEASQATVSFEDAKSLLKDLHS